ncbi:UNVERIFIED_CONTAM: hypothetical protein Scaly_0922400 [Sesamum calycinum]|uniref:RNase H type-1 domain-containing protein n=1 Tax=Sesamum calycinum TaxID=2727403 RepID=A0AAW2QXC1_9LAMI
MNTNIISGNLGAGCLVTKKPSCGYFVPSWKASFQHSGVRTVNLELLLTRFQVQHYSSKNSGGGTSRKTKRDHKAPMKEDKESFFVVRKGDLIGVYKSLSDCQAQVGTSIRDPPVSVYKGCSMPKDTEKSADIYIFDYFLSSNSLISCITLGIKVPSSSRGETSNEPIARKRSQGASLSDSGRSCTLEFDGASKGNPGQAGAGAIVRSDDGTSICRLREGLGIATNNVAEYRGFILGLKYALGKGFTNVRVRGDSKLVCMQIQGLWKVKNQNISTLYEEAMKLKDMFLSFQIIHILRDLNSEADAQANLAVNLSEITTRESMAFRFIAYLACIVFLAAVVAAHEGHDHQNMAPSLSPAPPPQPSGALSSSPSVVVGFLALLVSFFAVIGKRL